MLYELIENVQTFFCLQVDDHALLTTIEGHIVKAFVMVIMRWEITGVVTAWRFYLNYLGPQVCQHHRTERTSKHGR